MHSRRPPSALFVLLLFSAVLLAGCERLVGTLFLHPERDFRQTPGALGLTYEEHFFPAADGVQLHGWWLPGRPEGPTVLILQQGDGNISTQVDLLRQFHDWLSVNLLIFDYRGFGHSEGNPTDAGLVADVAGARLFLETRGWDRHGLVLYGKGIGAALAAGSALATPASGIVMEAAFPDLEALLRARHPLVGSLLAPWLTGRFDTLQRARELSTPSLFLHGDRDRRVPIGLGWQVFDAYNGPKRFRTVVGANHRDAAFVSGKTYWGAWQMFLSDIGGRAGIDPRAAPR